jgi:hypothetical protein
MGNRGTAPLSPNLDNKMGVICEIHTPVLYCTWVENSLNRKFCDPPSRSEGFGGGKILFSLQGIEPLLVEFQPLNLVTISAV